MPDWRGVALLRRQAAVPHCGTAIGSPLREASQLGRGASECVPPPGDLQQKCGVTESELMGDPTGACYQRVTVAAGAVVFRFTGLLLRNTAVQFRCSHVRIRLTAGDATGKLIEP